MESNGSRPRRDRSSLWGADTYGPIANAQLKVAIVVALVVFEGLFIFLAAIGSGRALAGAAIVPIVIVVLVVDTVRTRRQSRREQEATRAGDGD